MSNPSRNKQYDQMPCIQVFNWRSTKIESFIGDYLQQIVSQTRFKGFWPWEICAHHSASCESLSWPAKGLEIQATSTVQQNMVRLAWLTAASAFASNEGTGGNSKQASFDHLNSLDLVGQLGQHVSNTSFHPYFYKHQALPNNRSCRALCYRVAAAASQSLMALLDSSVGSTWSFWIKF